MKKPQLFWALVAFVALLFVAGPWNTPATDARGTIDKPRFTPPPTVGCQPSRDKPKKCPTATNTPSPAPPSTPTPTFNPYPPPGTPTPTFNPYPPPGTPTPTFNPYPPPGTPTPTFNPYP